MKIEKIYLDMDGVIADFDHAYFEMYGLHPREAEKHQRFDSLFKKFIEEKRFETLRLMPEALSLIDYLERIGLYYGIETEILSSTARPEYHKTISAQKKKWLETFSINFKTNFVPGKSKKKEFSGRNNIIIDDTLDVITDWEFGGNVAIHHRNVPETMAILKTLMKYQQQMAYIKTGTPKTTFLDCTIS